MKYLSPTFIITICLCLLIPNSTLGQKISENNNEIRLTKADSIYASKLPKLTLPIEYKSGGARNLPNELNNALLPFFRPNFSQGQYWNCGQAASIGYNFTYEINATRGLSADTSINQYSPMFTFNFVNINGWGVNYFNSFDIIKACGNPNLYDYGGLFNYGNTGWITGYEKYEDAMKNRITDVYSIDVGTPEGLVTLKYWLLDHLNGSEYGGVANYYLGGKSAVKILPPESPDPGFPVNIELKYPASHAMTIVGFNDSIRYDINQDGKFTNDIDITGDGIVDMKDWELGALKYMNSSTYNSGRGYLMYRVLAMEYGEGGIWNQQMHVIKVNENYQPLATLRLRLKHNSRDKIKVLAGVSSNPNSTLPDYTMDFPILNFNGGNLYMRGFDSTELHKEIEISLDISQLYSHISNNEESYFFVQLVEDDINDIGEGEILYCAINTGSNLLESNETPINIKDNNITTLKLSVNASFSKVKINNDNIPQLQPNINETINFTAEGGYPPYSWNVLNKYTLNPIPNDFPLIDDEKLVYENYNDTLTIIELPFEFPFFNDTISTIAIYNEGFISLNEKPILYPFYLGEKTKLINNKVIAPFMSKLVILDNNRDGIWINKHNDYIGIRWSASTEYNYEGNIEFCVLLFPDGRIQTYYGIMVYPGTFSWCSGISAGDKTNYLINKSGGNAIDISNSAFEYIPDYIHPDYAEINHNGELKVQIKDESKIYPISIQVKDSKGISDERSYNLTTSGLNIDYEINANNSMINFTDTTSIGINIINNSTVTYNNSYVKFTCNDRYLLLDDTIKNIGIITPGQSILISNANEFFVAPFVPDMYNSNIVCEFFSDENYLITTKKVIIKSPKFSIAKTRIIDNNNNIIYPGETAKLQIIIQNNGHSRSTEDIATLSSNSDELYIPVIELPIRELYPGKSDTLEFNISANWNIAMGSPIELSLKLFKQNINHTTLYKNINIGHIPVLVIDFTPNINSGIKIYDDLTDLGFLVVYTNNPTTEYLNNYLSVFICLGSALNPAYLSEQYINALDDYLSSSGNIYIEGVGTWNSANQSSLNSLFNISSYTKSFSFLDTIVGVNSTFTDGLIYNCEESYTTYSDNYLLPKEGAITFYIDNYNDSSGVVIANENHNYKTVGSNILYSAILDNDTICTQEEYLLSILDFFDLKKYMYVDIPQNDINPHSNITINVYPNPVKHKLNIWLTNPTKTKSLYQIIDIHGKIIHHEDLTFTDNTYSTTWNCTDQDGNSISPGIYFIIFTSGNQQTTKKIILN